MGDAAISVRTERLVLRRFTPDDAERLVALHGDPDVMRFIDTGRPVPRTEVLERTLPEFIAGPGLPGDPVGAPGVWAAELAANGEFIGWFSLRPTTPGRVAEAELGYRLRRAAWGRGYATEGARAVIAYGFAELGVRRVTATTMTVNTGSRRVMEKAGLRHVRTFFEEWPDHIEGAELGDVEYAVSRGEWECLGSG
ncbi:GNAT family N-acetyltransferase [Streptomyces inhibens]|uniref:GNAT family N-acetyltransferase n=1 Tax=Streptomyces inhibens TaxID=2293571 RepID=UPI001EE7717D|nr:GNAT family N-acetyltransferase [Streptomyces inhibens]UKY52273.1 GNAT family N-acetyltransferase [Streptomyces inhibens]